MYCLQLLRHAKSDWNNPQLQDIERPLNQRGINAIKKTADWLRQQGNPPHAILCSPAVRTRQTLEHLRHTLDIAEPAIQFIPEIYEANLQQLLDILEHAPWQQSPVMLIGHNPGMEELLAYLSRSAIPVTSSGKRFTTANLAILESHTPALIPGNFELRQLIRPKQLG